MTKEEKFSFKVLIKRDPDAWVAHCLELDLVAVADTVDQVEKDIIDIMVAHVRYAIENDNVWHMFHPAPPEVWRAFFTCNDREETCYRKEEPEGPENEWSIVPIIQASKCYYRSSPHA